jgi:hypothetical protein
MSAIDVRLPPARVGRRLRAGAAHLRARNAGRPRERFGRRSVRAVRGTMSRARAEERTCAASLFAMQHGLLPELERSLEDDPKDRYGNHRRTLGWRRDRTVAHWALRRGHCCLRGRRSSRTHETPARDDLRERGSTSRRGLLRQGGAGVRGSWSNAVGARPTRASAERRPIRPHFAQHDGFGPRITRSWSGTPAARRRALRRLLPGSG